MSNIADIYDKYNDIIYILGLLIDIICDYLFFYLITPINRSKKQNIVFIVVTFPIIFLYGGGGELGVLISEFFQVLTFYIVYKYAK